VLGLPTEGDVGDRDRIGRVASDVVTVDITASVADAREAARASGIENGPIVVLGDGQVVLGVLQRVALQLSPETRVEGVMQPAPGTIRPDLRVADVVRQLDDDGLAEVLVTSVDGVLVGLAVRDDLHSHSEVAP
jgi:predicted transcriptional regulator